MNFQRGDPADEVMMPLNLSLERVTANKEVFSSSCFSSINALLYLSQSKPKHKNGLVQILALKRRQWERRILRIWEEQVGGRR